MMLTHWMLYALVVSAALAAVALAVDHALRLYGRPTRWVWATSLLGGLVLPLLAFWRAPVPTASGDIGSVLPVASAAAFPVAAGPVVAPPLWQTWLAAVSAHGDEILLAVWLLATVLLAVYGILSYRRLGRLRRQWAETVVDGRRVLVSESAGPAVVGLRRPKIVLPSWVLAETEPRRRLIVAHEAEHVAAGDPRLLASACGALLLAPWNPLVWWQLHRLRLASELDCDARVLRKGVDLRGYAGLLLDVGERFGRAPLAAAFAEPRSVLARRLGALTARKPARRALRAAGGAVLALAIVGIAGATPLPQRPALGALDASPASARVQQPQVLLQVDSAGRYVLNGKPVAECMPWLRATPSGEEACRSRLAALIGAAFQAGKGDSVLAVRVHPTRLVRDFGEAIGYVRYAGAVRIDIAQTAPPGLVLGEEPAPEAPDAVRQQRRLELEVLPAGRYSVMGVPLTRGQLVPFLRKLYGSRADKSIYFKTNQFASMGDVLAAGAAAKAAALEVAGSSSDLVGGMVPPPPPPPPDLPAPAGVQVFTPYTVAPELTNRVEIRKALTDNYPPVLKQAGVGGTVLVWALVNEQGAVPSALLAQTSGRAELDDAALKVTRMMRFTPARNKDEAVKVWIKLPIVFKTSADGKSAQPAGKVSLDQARPADAPPPPPVPGQDITQAPTFTPYTVAPELANRETVRKALQENYPPVLKQAGVGGTVVVWALIDEQGGVPKTAVKKGSGHAELDSAALNVARVMRFVPGKNGPQVVKVWVQLPIVFRTAPERQPAAGDTAGMGATMQKVQKEPVAGLKRDSHYGIPGLPEGYTPPQLLNRDEVAKLYASTYPPETRKNAEVAWLLLGIDASGKVTSSNLLVASGDAALNKAAYAVARVVRFQPALDGAGKAAAVKVGYPVAARSQHGAVY